MKDHYSSNETLEFVVRPPSSSRQETVNGWETEESDGATLALLRYLLPSDGAMTNNVGIRYSAPNKTTQLTFVCK